MSLHSEFKENVLSHSIYALEFLDRHWKELRKIHTPADLELIYNKFTEMKGALTRLEKAKVEALPVSTSPTGGKIEEQLKLYEPAYQRDLIKYKQQLKDKGYPDFYADDKRKIEGLLARNSESPEKLLVEARRMSGSIKMTWKAFLRGNAARANGREDLASIFYVRGIDLANQHGGTVDWT